MSKKKYPFVVKTLENRLEFEKKMMNNLIKHKNKNMEWAKTNMDTCEYRMNELINGIELLKRFEDDTK